MSTNSGYRQMFNDFNRLNIMIIGDVMVDAYLWGKVDRISPEAPIPIVTLAKRENRMGGAANVAMNVKALGATPFICSVIGNDEKGNQFLDLLESEGISSDNILRSEQRLTTTKFRIFGNTHQMLRVDEETDTELTPEDQERLFQQIRRSLTEHHIDCIIFQDYDKGVITPSLIRMVVDFAAGKNIPVTVDPKKRNFLEYKHVTLFKPNLKELKEGLNLPGALHDNPSLILAAEQLRKTLDCRYVLTTLSERGVMISHSGKDAVEHQFIPAHLRTISDVSGAGDTVITVASMCLALGRSPYEIAFIANLAGGLVCEEVGVVPPDRQKLLEEVITLL